MSREHYMATKGKDDRGSRGRYPLNLPPYLKKLVARTASAMGITKNALIVRALEHYLAVREAVTASNKARAKDNG